MTPGSVIDASVTAAWAFREAQYEQALALLRDRILYAPPLLAYELAHVAQKKALADGLITENERRLMTALALDIHWVAIDHLEVYRLALQTGLTTYDATYLVAARTAGLPLLTFDRQLQRAAASLNIPTA